jgi:predicted dehydrogenase
MEQNKMKTKEGHERLTRRQFMHKAGAVAAAVAAASVSTRAAGTAKSANERLGIGVIGCGGRGNGHLRILKWMKDDGDNIDIVAVSDVYRPRMQRAAEGYGAKGYMDHRELLADPNVDIVTVATPDHHHGYQVIDAVKAHKGVYAEKPITHWRQFDLLKRMTEEVKKSGKTFQLGTQGMSDSAWHQMKRLVKDGLIGKPLVAECGYFRVGDWGERGMPIDDPNAKPGKDLNWEAFLGDSPKREFDVSRFFRWRMYEDYAGGPVTDLYPHSLTPVADIVNISMPSAVVATGGKYRYEEREVPDTFNMLIDCPQGFTIAVMGTQGNNYVANGQRGAGSRIPVIRGWEGTLTIDIKTNKIVFIPVEGSKKKPQSFDIEHGEDLVEHMRNFISCVRKGSQETFSPVDLAYRTQTALIMGMLSLRAGKTARFGAAKEEILL